MSSKPMILCLMGPTAAGKTPLAVEIVQRFACEIVSVDSVMVYRGMNIGAAKPDAKTLKLAPHRLIDIVDPSDIYSVGRFLSDAMREIKDIINRGNIPLLVGGTMMYFRALQQGLAQLPTANKELRAALLSQAERIGWEGMHAELARYDSEAAMRIHQKDSQRIARALEVYLLTGQPISTFQRDSTTKTFAEYTITNIILAPKERANLHKRIAKRFDHMLKEGMLDEVKALYARPDIHRNLPSIRSVGYAQVWDYLANEISFEVMREKAIIATRQFAKRQLTWLRSETFMDATWFDTDDASHIKAVFTMLKQLLRWESSRR